jgi:shikimate kinase
MDLDDVIVESAGRSIPEIFASDGEVAFRKMELEALMGILSASEPRQSCHPERSEGSVSLILALGGGTVMTPKCAEIVKEKTFCIYLRASIETLMEHLEDQTVNRPLLNGSERPDCHFERAERDEKSAMRDRIITLMSQRAETYEKTAHIIIDTDGKSIEAVASEIINLLN